MIGGTARQRCTQVWRCSKTLRRTAQSYRRGDTVTYSSLFQTWRRSPALRCTAQACRCGGARGHCDVQSRRHVVGVTALSGTAMCNNDCYRCDGIRRHREQLIGRRRARRCKRSGGRPHCESRHEHGGVQHDLAGVTALGGTARSSWAHSGVVYTRILQAWWCSAAP